jgi:hypothetical protein
LVKSLPDRAGVGAVDACVKLEGHLGRSSSSPSLG